MRQRLLALAVGEQVGAAQRAHPRQLGERQLAILAFELDPHAALEAARDLEVIVVEDLALAAPGGGGSAGAIASASASRLGRGRFVARGARHFAPAPCACSATAAVGDGTADSDGLTAAACASTRFDMNASRSSCGHAASACPPCRRFSSEGSIATRCLRSSVVALRLHAPDEVLERGDARAPGLAVLAVVQVRLLEARLPLRAQERARESSGSDTASMRRSTSAARRPCWRSLRGRLLRDLLGARLDVRLGGLLFLGEERLELLAQLSKIARSSENSSRIAWTIDLDLLVQRILVAHRRRPADPRLRRAR